MDNEADPIERWAEEDRLQSFKLEGIGQLAAGIAHDFNNILSVILNFSSFIISGDSDPQVKDDAEEIRKAAERGAALTRQLLIFSRKEVVKPKVLNINEALCNVSAMLRSSIHENIEVITRLESDLWNVEIDPGQLDMVLMNLAINARDAMSQGGVLTIETSNVVLDDTFTRSTMGAKPGAYVLLAVSDTGCGMPPEVVAKAFDPYFTTKPKGKGTGLGLSAVYGIVKRARGNVWVYSEPDVGTTFKIYLPATDRPEDEGDVAPAEVSPVGGRETVLVVEDEGAVLAAIRRILESNGYHVLEAANGTEALKTAGDYQGRIDLLLTDVILPQVSGRDLAQRLSKQRPGLRVLFMSGYNDYVIAHHNLVSVGVTVMRKPFTGRDLLSYIRGALDLCRTETD